MRSIFFQKKYNSNKENKKYPISRKESKINQIWPIDAGIQNKEDVDKGKEFQEVIWNKEELLLKKIENSMFDCEDEIIPTGYLNGNKNFIYNKNLGISLSKN